MRAGGKPVHDELRSVRGFKLLRLNVARKQRCHKQHRGENEQQFEGGDGAANRLHGFTLYCKVNIFAIEKCEVDHNLLNTYWPIKAVFIVLFYVSATTYLHFLCTSFILLLQFLPDTTPVIAQAGQKAPFALLPPTTSPVEAPRSILLATGSVSTERPRIHAEVGRYRLRLAQCIEDREAACRLRFKVFNIELGEGLERSYETGIDTDHFDIFCEHLLVEDKTDGRVVGTYRMQSGSTAAMNLGYYSAQEFEFAPYEPLRRDILELGRASIDREHRTAEVLTLLWRGIAQYASDMGLRYLVGCSSLNSKDPAEGWQMYRELDRYRVSPEFETVPTPAYECPCEQQDRGYTAIAGSAGL